MNPRLDYPAFKDDRYRLAAVIAHHLRWVMVAGLMLLKGHSWVAIAAHALDHSHAGMIFHGLH